MIGGRFRSLSARPWAWRCQMRTMYPASCSTVPGSGRALLSRRAYTKAGFPATVSTSISRSDWVPRSASSTKLPSSILGGVSASRPAMSLGRWSRRTARALLGSDSSPRTRASCGAGVTPVRRRPAGACAGESGPGSFLPLMDAPIAVDPAGVQRNGAVPGHVPLAGMPRKPHFRIGSRRTRHPWCWQPPTGWTWEGRFPGAGLFGCLETYRAGRGHNPGALQRLYPKLVDFHNSDVPSVRCGGTENDRGNR